MPQILTVDHAVDVSRELDMLHLKCFWMTVPHGLAWKGWMSSDTQHHEEIPAISGRGAQFTDMSLIAMSWEPESVAVPSNTAELIYQVVWYLPTQRRFISWPAVETEVDTTHRRHGKTSPSVVDSMADCHSNTAIDLPSLFTGSLNISNLLSRISSLGLSNMAKVRLATIEIQTK